MNTAGKTRLQVTKFFEALNIEDPMFWGDIWVVPYGSFSLETRKTTESEAGEWRITLYYGEEEIMRFQSNVLNTTVGLDIKEVVDANIKDVEVDLESKVYEVCNYIENNFGCILTPATGISPPSDINFREMKRWMGSGEYEDTSYNIEIFLAPQHNPMLSLTSDADHTKMYHEVHRDLEKYKPVIADFFSSLSPSDPASTP